MVCFKHKLIMKLNIFQIICLINYVLTFPNDLFDELWQTNQSELQANNNPIKSQPKEEQFDERWRDESKLKGIVKVEHLGAVKVEGTVRIKHEFESWDEENGEFKKQLESHVKEEDQDGQAPKTSADDYDQNNSKKHLSDQNNSTDQDESVDKQQNKSNKSEKIKSYQQKRKILQQFDQIKSKCKAKLKNISMRELDGKIANKFGVCAKTIYEWKRKFGLSVSNKKFSELEKREILKQFYEIKNKCKKAKLKNISMKELDDKIAKKCGVSRDTIYIWKRNFGLSVCNQKFSDATKIEIFNKYAKIKGENPKMSDCDIADLLTISRKTISKWKFQFSKENKQL